MMNSHPTNPSATTTSTNPTSSGVMNEHLSDSQLPKAEEVELTPEEVEFISTNTSSGSGSGSGSEDESEGDMSGDGGDKKHVRMSKGAVGAAVVGGVVGAVMFGGLGAVALAGGAVYATTKSKKVKKGGEVVYSKLAKAGKATKKGLKKVKGKFSSMRQRRREGGRAAISSPPSPPVPVPTKT